MRRAAAVIVLQARLGSSRLPGKALRDLEGCSVLARCLERLTAQAFAPVVLVTTRRREDDALVHEARARGVVSVRGPVADVLGRFTLVAELLAPEFLIRATGDNPAVDIDAAGRVLRVFEQQAADYVVEQQLPVGAAVEGIRTEALLDAAARTRDAYDREHVTPFLRRPGNGYRVVQPAAPDALARPDLRFTIDTSGDLAYMSRVFARAGRSPRLPLADLIRAADGLPEVEEVA